MKSVQGGERSCFLPSTLNSMMWMPFWALKNIKRYECQTNRREKKKKSLVRWLPCNWVHWKRRSPLTISRSVDQMSVSEICIMKHTHKICTSRLDRKPATQWSEDDAQSARSRFECHRWKSPRRFRQELGWMASSGCMCFVDQKWQKSQQGATAQQDPSFLHTWN